MFAKFVNLRKVLRPLAVPVLGLGLAACNPVALTNIGGDAPRINTSQPIPVALLIPKTDAGAAPIAVSLENAARLAMADLGEGVTIDLRVYDTGGQAPSAAAAAQKAVDEGAKIILGPLRADEVNAAGVAVGDEGVNVLGFSNNPTIAGGNVFILGPTFANTADRMMDYARRNGKSNVLVVYSDDVEGQLGKLAIEQAATVRGVTVVGSQGYQLSIEGVSNAAQAAGRVASAGAADAVFITTSANNAAMPMLLTQMPESGVTADKVQYIGLTRWDVRPDLFSMPGAQGAWFALPDTQKLSTFSSRYTAAYGAAPHPLAGLAYDGIMAVGTLAAAGRDDALSATALTSTGFTGTGGVFRLMSDGTNRRALAIATVENKQMVILDPAPSSLSGGGL
ncbi:penicillin-binding protein activator [Maliponia aquimaris]|uniref:Receptor family ligand binding region n=1 Tax=Maliponia aquimaris TaxID=1673631 RepID=A0A238K7V3_9RHOB|nr:penicillin-binding protein activator [Maliponia aquimaris]SMX38968.1 Receptor family ligand binding region [Maliponia aquimaris]